MSLVSAFQQVLGAGLEKYHKSRYWEICGVKVQFTPVAGGVPVTTWKDTLEEWLPKYDEAGWLEGLHKIRIGHKAAHTPDCEAVGRYDHDGSISLNNDIDLGVGYSLVHDASREAILTHEVVHHAHMSLNDYTDNHKLSQNEEEIKKHVSWYAKNNNVEAIAEIGTGIIHGENFPAWVHEFYEQEDGPIGAYDIG